MVLVPPAGASKTHAAAGRDLCSRLDLSISNIVNRTDFIGERVV
jgi:hypothetical protein